jgi:hypothetical protein
MDVDYDDDAQAFQWLETLSQVLGCTAGYVSNLIFWPAEGALTAAEVVDLALACRPIAL